MTANAISAVADASTGNVDADGLPMIRHTPLNHAWLATRHEEVIDPGLPIVDPHHHLWEREGGYLLDEILADTGSGHRILATVYSQCGYGYRTSGPPEMRPVGETDVVVKIAEGAKQRGAATDVCAGIVGFADLELGDAVEDVLQAHIEAGKGRFRGVRHIAARSESFNASLLGRPPADLFYRPSFRRGIARLQSLGLVFDAWVYHTQIHEVTDLARAMPDLPIVLDHVGGPLGVGPYAGQRDEVFATWRAAMKELATCPNVTVKLGGLAMAVCGFEFEKQPVAPSSQELAAAWGPLMQTSIELFGANRCMFESNFPVDKAKCSYVVLWNGFKRIASGASTDEKASLFKDTASAFYRLGLEKG